MVDTMKELCIKSDASDFATGAVLSMKCDDDKWHPCAYLSKGLNDVERNYDTHNKEMLGIMRALESWRHYLEGAKVQFEIWNNHEALDLDPNAIEPIAPIQHHPNYVPFFSTFVLISKPIALREAEEHYCNVHISIYCNGCGFEEGIGASAVMYTNSVETKHILYYLRPASRHTVYEGEIVVITYTLHLLTSLQAIL